MICQKTYHIAIKKAGPFIVLVITDLFRHLDYSLNVSMSLGKVDSPQGCLALPVLGAGLEDPSRTLSLSSDNSAHFSTIHKYSIYPNIHLDSKYFFQTAKLHISCKIKSIYE